MGRSSRPHSPRGGLLEEERSRSRALCRCQEAGSAPWRVARPSLEWRLRVAGGESRQHRAIDARRWLQEEETRRREDAKNCGLRFTTEDAEGAEDYLGWRDLGAVLLCRSREADSAPRCLTRAFEPRNARLPLRPLRPLRSFAVTGPCRATSSIGRRGASEHLCALRALCGQSASSGFPIDTLESAHRALPAAFAPSAVRKSQTMARHHDEQSLAPSAVRCA